jgi:hypothetical protein
MTFDDCRDEVKAFAVLMEAKLRENDHKGGWIGCEVYWLLDRLREEADEVAALVKSFEGTPPMRYVSATGELKPLSKSTRGRIGREAADVANFAMMLADVCGALPSAPPGTPRGSR